MSQGPQEATPGGAGTAAEPSGSPRPGSAFKVVGAVAAGLLVVVSAWWLLRPVPDLAPGLRLAEGGRYAEAEPKLSAYLAYDPSNPRAAMAMAEVLLNLEPPKPAEALGRLDAIRGATPPQAAFAMMLRGQADRALGRPGKAEAEWKEALRIDPLVAQAGWRLLDLYYTEGRHDELRRLALRLHRSEPDARDRVRLLLEPMRPDAAPLAASGVITLFRPVVQEHPDDLFAALAYYRAQAKDGTGIDEAMAGLKRLAQEHPDEPACWEGLLYAMSVTGDLDGLEATLGKLPARIASLRGLARYRGRLAESRRDFAKAAAEYGEALIDAPTDRELLHRLGEVHKLAGHADQAQAVKEREARVEEARVELRGIKGRELEEGRLGLFEDALGRPDLGRVPDLSLYRKLASVRERMGHPDEALAWHQLILRDRPDDAESREAVDRLNQEARGTGSNVDRP